MLLAGLIVPVYVIGKRSAKESYDLNSLRQIGVAADLYLQEQGAPALSCQPLVATHHVPKALVYAMLDPTKDGQANAWLEGQKARNPGVAEPVPSYPLTYLGLGDFGMHDIEQAELGTKAFPGPFKIDGWLVDFTISEREHPTLPYEDLTNYVGRYRLLRLDGGVEMRAIQTVFVTDKDGRKTGCMVPLWFFSTVCLEERLETCRGLSKR